MSSPSVVLYDYDAWQLDSTTRLRPERFFSMIEGQKVIYTARTMQDAHLLKNLLADERIQAIVLNEVLPGGSGVEGVGWATAARVVVAEKDALRARQIAVKFDRKMASSPGKLEGIELPEEPPVVLDEWPRCPECDAPRLTRCPVCGTAGTNFLPADSDFIGLPELDEAAKASAACSCGPDGCTPATATRETSHDEEEEDHVPPATDDHEAEPRTTLMCPTCDEPFEPQYPRRCEWCGHEFDDGYEVALAEGPAEEVGSHAILVILGLLALAAGLMAYFTFIVSPP